MSIGELFAYLVIYTLAAQGAINAWLHGSIFAALRARIEAYGDCHPKLVELASCRFCLSYQVPLWLTVGFFLPGWALGPTWGLVWQTPVLALAVARLCSLVGFDGTTE